MKAAVYTKTESDKVLEIIDVEKPTPTDDEVLIRVHAASVNPLDWRLKRRRPGVDVSGVIEVTGKKVTQFKPGDAVFGSGKGAFAEYATASERNLVPKPDHLTFEQAASVPIAALTALQGLRDKGQLQPGQKVLINGAAGGVGTFSVQIAKSMGAHVTGICSTRNVEMVRLLGADRVIDYTNEDFAQTEERYDLVLDNVANRRISALKRVLAPTGKWVMVGAPKETSAVLLGLLNLYLTKIGAFFSSQTFKFFIARIRTDDLMTICELIKTGKITPAIDKCYPLNEAANAIAYVQTCHARAKVIISMG